MIEYNYSEFDEHLDSFVTFRCFGNYINAVLNDINTSYGGIDNSTFYLDSRLIPGYFESENGVMTFEEAYYASEFFYHFFAYLGFFSPHVQEMWDYLEQHNITIWIYDENGAFSLLSDEQSQIGSVSMYLPNEPANYVIAFCEIEYDFYSYLKAYQDSYDNSPEDPIVPIYVYGAYEDTDDEDPLIVKDPDQNSYIEYEDDIITLEQFVAILGSLFNS